MSQLFKLAPLLLTIVSAIHGLQFSPRCAACSVFFDSARKVFDSQGFINKGESLLTHLCEVFEKPEICTGLIGLYEDPVILEVSTRFLDSAYMCAHIGACPSQSHIYQNLTAYTSEVLSDLPAVAPWPAASGSSYSILQVTDIHADFFYKEGSAQNCDLPLCCRDGTGSAGHFGSFGNCDLPPATVELFLQQVAKMDVRFVMWTGDNPPHDIWAYERQKEMDVTSKLVSMFKEHLKVPVYPIIGNHDCFPMDLFNPDHEQELLQALSGLWKDWLTPEAVLEFTQNGYYSLKDASTGLRILGMNNQLGDNFNLYLIANNTDPGSMLQWLRGALRKAELAGEKVIILGHIPHGDHFVESLWARHYRVLVSRFQNTIVGQFFGHTHYDEFNLVKSAVPGQEYAGVLNVAPSLTTYSQHNPSFRLYEYDAETHHLLNIHQYRLPLHNPAAFEKVFDYATSYGMDDMSPRSFGLLAQRVRDSESVGQLFSENFNGQYSFQADKCDSDCRRTLYCRLQSDVFDENYKCDPEHNSEERLFYILELLYGKQWEYK